jgi:hypothetical protein
MVFALLFRAASDDTRRRLLQLVSYKREAPRDIHFRQLQIFGRYRDYDNKGLFFAADAIFDPTPDDAIFAIMEWLDEYRPYIRVSDVHSIVVFRAGQIVAVFRDHRQRHVATTDSSMIIDVDRMAAALHAPPHNPTPWAALGLTLLGWVVIGSRMWHSVTEVGQTHNN